MAFSAIHNRRGFFSDYWIGTLLSSRAKAGARLSAVQVRKVLDRVIQIVDAMEGLEAPQLTRFRESFARPLLEDLLGFRIHENAAEPRLRPLGVRANNASAPLALALLVPNSDELDTPRTRRLLEDALLLAKLDYGLVVTPTTLRLLRRPGLGARGAMFDLSLASLAETDDVESLSAAYRVFVAENFELSADGVRTIDTLEAESRHHSARVSNDLKAAVFEAAECIVGGFLADVRARGESIDPVPSVETLRDAGFLALYRLLFILYAEARDERLINHGFYQRNYSLDSIVTRVLRTPAENLAANGYGLWAHLLAVFRIFNEGIEPHLPQFENIPPRGGRLFSDETPEGKWLRRLRLNDRDTARILLALATTRPRRGVGRERVSFRELEIEQLGHVYEGLLEYEPAQAREPMIEVRLAGRELALTPAEVVGLSELKQLHVRGDAALVQGTVAERLHPDWVADAERDDADEPDAQNADDATEEGDDAEPGIERGASLQLLRRIEPGEFYFKPGAARKASGSYYTPTPMVDDLARGALGPLVEDRSAAEIERLRIIDIACGSGHFLVGAARFLAPRLFEAYRREGSGEPPAEFHPARVLSAEVRARWEAEGLDWCRRRIVERCLFGVDLNPAAVQLAQVALWIESLAGDRPLSFFAHHVRCGNSLLGGFLARFDAPPDPKLGKPNDRFTRGLFETELKRKLDEALAERRLIDAPLPPEIRRDTPEEYAYKEDRLRRAEKALVQAKLLLDLRSASAFVPAIWRDFPILAAEPDPVVVASRSAWWNEFETIRLRERFFHWELEFPEVLMDQDRPGFDAVIGNPPWDEVRPKKYEFYSRCDVLIRALTGNDLERRIQELYAAAPDLKAEYDDYCTRIATLRTLLRQEEDFPLSESRSHLSRVDLSKYFIDRAVRICREGGRIGMVVPSILYNGDACVGIRRYLLGRAAIQRFYGFENRQKVFPIDSRYKFVNLVFENGATANVFDAAFMRHDLDELNNEERKPWQVRITREEVARLSPETLAFLEYRGPRDQEIVRKMHEGKPTLGGQGTNTWRARLFDYLAHENLFNATWDKDLWSVPSSKRLYSAEIVLGSTPTGDGEAVEHMRAKGFLPVYEGKHIEQFLVGTKPIRWWLSIEQATRKYRRGLRFERTLVFRETASNTNERTCIAAVLPEQSAGAHTLTGVVTQNVDPDRAALVLNSLCFDFALRLRTAGTHVSFTYILPMPVPPAEVVNRLPVVPTRLAWDAGIDHVTDDESAWPALWEANKAVALAYGLDADDFAHILGAFPVFARKRPKFMAYLQTCLSEWRR